MTDLNLVCDHDGEPLSVRGDDRAETVQRRADVVSTPGVRGRS